MQIYHKEKTQSVNGAVLVREKYIYIIFIECIYDPPLAIGQVIMMK